VYHSNPAGDWEIYRLEPLSWAPDAPANLSRGPESYDGQPSISPDRRHIVFVSERDGLADRELYRVRVDGEELRRLTVSEGADEDPAWGPSGRIAFVSERDGNREIYLMDAQSGAVTRLTNNDMTDEDPFWSPDGSQIVFRRIDASGISRLVSMDIASGQEIVLGDGAGSDSLGQYSNDGARIAFVADFGAEGMAAAIMNADGTDVALISPLAPYIDSPVWSPDDALIAYTSGVGQASEVYIYEVSSGQTRRLTENDVPDYAPTWRCFSHVVAWTSDITGDAELFQVLADPIDAPPVDILREATRLTEAPDRDDMYPADSPGEESDTAYVFMPPMP
jgi:TolB protein